MRKCGLSVLLAVGLHNLSGLVFTVLHLHSQCNPVPNLPPSVQSNHATLASSPVTALVHISVFMETDFWVFSPQTGYHCESCLVVTSSPLLSVSPGECGNVGEGWGCG